MHITGAAETTGADAVAIPSPIIWSGRVSVLAPVEKDLLWFIIEYHEQGIQVTIMMIRKYAKKKLPSVFQKSSEVNCQAIRCFLH